MNTENEFENLLVEIHKHFKAVRYMEIYGKEANGNENNAITISWKKDLFMKRLINLFYFKYIFSLKGLDQQLL